MSEIDPSQLEGDMIPQGRYKPARELKELHENTDLDVKSVLFNTGVLVALCAVTFWAITLVMDHFKSEEREMEKAALSMRFSESPPPPAPVLQAEPHVETQELAATARRRLDSYGWNDSLKKKAHIPISRAIEILSEKGLPQGGRMDQFHPQTGSSNAEKIGVPAEPAPAAPEPKP